MRSALLLCALLSTSAYTHAHAYAEHQHHARSTQQLLLGQAHLSAIPVRVEEPRFRLTLGGALGGELRPSDPYSEDPAEHHVAPASGHIGVSVRLGSVELGLVLDEGFGSSEEGELGPPEGSVRQYAFRFRASPGGRRFSVNMSFEFGARVSQARVTQSCESEAGCPDRRIELGRAYFATTVYPTLRIGDSAYIFLGFGLSSGDTYTVDVDDDPDLNVYDEDRTALYSTLGGGLRISDSLTVNLSGRQLIEDRGNAEGAPTPTLEANLSLLF